MAWLVLIGLWTCGHAWSMTTLAPAGEPIEVELPRYGLNLGGSGTWGAEQLRANILTNPGFEAVLDRSLLIVGERGFRQLVDDNNWLARADGFWTGARYDIRSGVAAGRSGRVLDSRKRVDGHAVISTDAGADEASVGDVVVLTRHHDPKPAPGWWLDPGPVTSAFGDTPPASPGRQSLRLQATPWVPSGLHHYFDNIGDRAGKLLPVRGRWRLALWARAPAADATLHVHFDRGGHTLFLAVDITPGSRWQHYVYDFDAQDDGPPGVLTLGLQARGGEIRIDDAYLGEIDAGVGGFRRQVLDTLKTLRPGFLRDWQGQLGDTLANRLAPPQGHQPVRYRPGDTEHQFHYGLPDFLTLCAAVGAQPWVVAPTTLDDTEWQRLGTYLHRAADRHGFHTLLVEFGNENWNPLFRPGGIPDPARHAAVADRAFRLLRIGSGNDERILTVANAQFADPASPRQMGARSRAADRVAVAPYFLFRLEAGVSAILARQLAFADSDELLREEARTASAQGKRLSVYEENFHTTLGSADPDSRNRLVSSAASGAALARRLLQGTLAGVREQAVYSFAGFDSYLQQGQGLVRLWGITRDLAAANRLRPTGLALQLLNSVAGGRARRVDCEGDACAELTAVAFDDDRLAVVSASSQPVPLGVSLACPSGQLTLDWLDGSALEATNESETRVHIQTRQLDCLKGQVRLTLPAYSLGVIHP